MKRTGKFYRRNEQEVMKQLGFIPTKGSGCGWIEKGDGYNEVAVCELKSTDAQSYRLHLEDLHKIQAHANTSHKLPVFIVQFLQSQEMFAIVPIENFNCETANVVKSEFITNEEPIVVDVSPVKVAQQIKSSSDARMEFHLARENQYKRNKSAT